MRRTVFTVVLLALVSGHGALSDALAGAVLRQETNRLVGRWTIDLSRSEQAPSSVAEGTTVQFVTDGGTTTLIQRVPGQPADTRFSADGRRQMLAPGIAAVTTIPRADVFEVVMTIRGDLYGRATYEVSADGRTLVGRLSTHLPDAPVTESVLVFDRE